MEFYAKNGRNRNILYYYNRITIILLCGEEDDDDDADSPREAFAG